MYRRGRRAFVLTPALLAVVVVPEFVQHVVEVELGMFASRAAFVAHGADPTRMAFGAVKGVGLVLAAMLVMARFWWNGASALGMVATVANLVDHREFALRHMSLPMPLVLAIMAADALVVGLLASLVGAGLAVGYAWGMRRVLDPA